MKNIKSKILGGAVALLGLGAVAHGGHHLGFYDLSPFYDFINFNPAEFGWATWGTTLSYFGIRSGYEVVKSNMTHNQDLNEYNTKQIIKSNAELQEVMEDVDKKLDIIIESEIDKKKALAELDIAPESIKDLAVQSYNKLKGDSLDILEDAAQGILDSVEDAAQAFIDKGVNIIDQELKKLGDS